jgi:hypothetical protein
MFGLFILMAVTLLSILEFLFSALLKQSVRNATGRFLCIIQQMLRGTGVSMRALRGIMRPGRSQRL